MIKWEVSKIKKTKEQHIKSLLNFVALGSMIMAVVFIVLLILSRNEQIQLWYKTYQDYLFEAELAVENMGDAVEAATYVSEKLGGGRYLELKQDAWTRLQEYYATLAQ